MSVADNTKDVGAGKGDAPRHCIRRYSEGYDLIRWRTKAMQSENDGGNIHTDDAAGRGNAGIDKPTGGEE